MSPKNALGLVGSRCQRCILHYSRTGNVTGHGLAGQQGVPTGGCLWPSQFGDDGNKPGMFQHPRDRGVPKKNGCGDIEIEGDRLPSFGFGSMGLHPNSSSSSSPAPLVSTLAGRRIAFLFFNVKPDGWLGCNRLASVLLHLGGRLRRPGSPGPPGSPARPAPRRGTAGPC